MRSVEEALLKQVLTCKKVFNIVYKLWASRSHKNFNNFSAIAHLLNRRAMREFRTHETFNLSTFEARPAKYITAQ